VKTANRTRLPDSLAPLIDGLKRANFHRAGAPKGAGDRLWVHVSVAEGWQILRDLGEPAECGRCGRAD
jgi:hypothetical protein